MKKLLVICLLVLVESRVFSQDLEEEFARFKSMQTQDFREEVLRQDSIFALAIRENWKSFQLNEPYEYLPEYPKPSAQPQNEQELKQIRYEPEPTVQKLRSFEPEVFEALDFYPEEDKVAAFNFYGQACSLKYPSTLTNDLPVEASREYVSEFWQSSSQKPYHKLVNDLIAYKQQLNIPGYGFMIMLQDFTTYLNVSPFEETMYQWFLLSKAGYDTKVGFSNGRAFLIVASENKIYGKPYFELAGVTYYVLDDEVAEIETYGKVDTNAEAMLDFAFKESPDLPLNPRSKQLQFTHGNVEYNWEIFYNLNVVNLLEDFPVVDLPSHFNSKGSFLLERSLQKQIGDAIAQMTEVEAISLLLSFSQKAFEYQTDQVQFGYEKIFFPDQLMHYPYSDCDDRVVFMNYLVRLFLDVETVALLFPQHIALGVRLAQPAYGETLDFGGKSFTFCDPTFYNAPLGTVIPQADREQMRVLIY